MSRPPRTPRPDSRRARSRRAGGMWRFLRFSLGFTLLLATAVAVVGAVVGVRYYQKVARELPDVALLRTWRPNLVTRVYDRAGGLLREFFIERRFLLDLDEIPDVVIQATLATEDARFLDHPGVDMVGVVRAAVRNFIDWGIVEGGSTITQQLAKTLFLSSRRTWDRKLREAILAIRIERRFSKREILNLYLNQIYYGHGAYGIEAAARTYFGKRARLLTLAQAALLAGLPRAPSLYTPLRSKGAARRRRAHVLRRMMEEGFITPAQREVAARAPIVLARRGPVGGEADYAVEYVRQEVARRFGSNRLYRAGLKVYTTIRRKAQEEVTRALRRGLRAVDRRRGYRGPIGRVERGRDRRQRWKMVSSFMEAHEDWPEVRAGRWLPAVVEKVARRRALLRLREGPAVLLREDAEWARPFAPAGNDGEEGVEDLRRVLRAGDVILVEPLPAPAPASPSPSPGRGGGARRRVALVQPPEVQGGAIVIEPETGAIVAMAGGYAFARSQFNRAVQAVRPPGSAFKPMTYSAALSRGWTPADIIVDAPVVFPAAGPGGEEWKPTNFERRFYGPTTLREGLVRSRNVVTVKLAQAVGIGRVIARARRFGIRSPLRKNLSLALGSSGVTLAELTSAYAALANLGRRREPHILRRVEDADGKVIWRALPKVEQVIPPAEAYVMLDLLQQVIQRGTARRARRLRRPLAGKTGTTNDFQDAWFVGASPFYAAGVWVGMDDKSSLGRGETGARAALPIWMDIIAALHEGLPADGFRRPPGVRVVFIDPETGVRLPPDAPGAVRQAFVEGTEPAWTPLDRPAGGEGEGELPEWEGERFPVSGAPVPGAGRFKPFREDGGRGGGGEGR